MFTYSCDQCRKAHTIYRPFEGPFDTKCFRCSAPLHITPANITEPASSPATRPGSASKPAARAPQPAPAPVAEEQPPPPVAKLSTPTRRTYLLPAGLIGATACAVLAGVLYFTGAFGAGPPATKAPPPPAPTPPKAVIAAALQAQGPRFEKVRLQDASLADGQLTLAGCVATGAQKTEVEALAVSAVVQAGFDRPRQVVNKMRGPLEIVQQAVARKFGKQVVVTGVVLEKGRLRLEGALSKWQDKQPAREVAVAALVEAGLGPIPSWDNRLRKPNK